MWRKAKGRVVGERPFATGAFQPQNPGAKDANTVVHHDPKRTSPAVVDGEGALGGTVGASLAVARALSRLKFFRVVLDFLFCCHNLEDEFDLGGCAAIVTIRFVPFFYFPNGSSKGSQRIRKKGEAGSDFDKSWGGVNPAGSGSQQGAGVRETGIGRPESRGGIPGAGDEIPGAGDHGQSVGRAAVKSRGGVRAAWSLK